MRNRWIKIDSENNILALAYLNDPSPELLNKVNPGNWIQVGDADVSDPKYDMAQIGGIYDAERDVCLPIKPYPSWVIDENTNSWIAPVDPPNGDPFSHVWDEESQSWL